MNLKPLDLFSGNNKKQKHIKVYLHFKYLFSLCNKVLLSLICFNYFFIMDITFSTLFFASRTIPTDFGLIAAAIAGAGSLILIALRFVPDSGN